MAKSRGSSSRSRPGAWSAPTPDTPPWRAPSVTLDDMAYGRPAPSVPAALTPRVNRHRLQALAMPSRQRAYAHRPDPRKVRKAHQYALDSLYWPSEWFLPPSPQPSQKNRLAARLLACAGRYVRRQVLFSMGLGGMRGQVFKRKYSNVRC